MARSRQMRPAVVAGSTPCSSGGRAASGTGLSVPRA